MAEGRSDGTAFKVAVIGLVSAVLVALIYSFSPYLLKAFRLFQPQVELTVIVSDTVANKEAQKPEPIQGARVTLGAGVTADCAPMPEQTIFKQILTDGGGKAHFYLDPKPGSVCVTVVASGFSVKGFPIDSPTRDVQIEVGLERSDQGAHPDQSSPTAQNKVATAIPTKAKSPETEPTHQAEPFNPRPAQTAGTDGGKQQKEQASSIPSQQKQQTTAEVVPPKRGGSNLATTPSPISIYAVPREEPLAERVVNQIKSGCFTGFPFSAAQDLDSADWVLVGNKKMNATILYLIPRRSYSEPFSESLHKKAVWTYTVDDSNIDQEAEWACTGQGGLREQSNFLRSQLK